MKNAKAIAIVAGNGQIPKKIHSTPILSHGREAMYVHDLWPLPLKNRHIDSHCGYSSGGAAQDRIGTLSRKAR